MALTTTVLLYVALKFDILFSRSIFFFNFTEEFVAHGASVNCLALGHKSGRVLVTGGDDKKVNLWAVGKPNCIMVSEGFFHIRV